MTTQPTTTGTIGASPSLGKVKSGWRIAFGSRGTLGWLIAGAAIAIAAVGILQVSNRAPLVWDEAARVDAGSQLADAIRSFDLGGIWQWLNSQIFYPFVGPALNGLTLLVTGNPQVAAWFPSLIAYGLSGVFAGRLAGALGAGPIGALCAGVLCWATPIGARLAAGAFTEPIGACLILLVLLGLVSLDRHRGPAFPALIGVLVAVTWFMKYDYGLLALGTAALTALVTLATRGTWERLRTFVVLMGTAVVLIAGWFSVNFAGKFHGAGAFIGQAVPGSPGSVDLLYYLRAPFVEGEVGLAPVIALIFVLGVLTVVAYPKRPLTDAPLICLALWFLIYSTATIKYPRYFGFITPLLATFSGLLVGRLAEWLKGKTLNPLRVGLLSLATGLVVWQLVLQAAGPAGVRTQFWFLAPDPEADQALSIISDEPNCKTGPLVLIGQTNEVSPAAVHLAWTERLGHQAPSVRTVAEVAPEQREIELRAAVSRACRIVGVDIQPGARLDTVDFRTNFASQADYVRIAKTLVSNGLLRPVRTASTADGLVEVTIWAPA